MSARSWIAAGALLAVQTLSGGQASRASAAPAAVSNTAVSAPGGDTSAAGIAKNQGAAVEPVGTPATFALANGVALTATYLSESAGNPLGGLKQGAAYAGQVFGGLDFDMKTIAGIDGGSVHFAMVQRHGDSASARFIGNNTSVQEIYGSQKLRLTIFTYQQKLMDGKIDLEIGRSAGNSAFLTSPLYCLFQSNAVCGSPVYAFKATNFTAFPASGWGGHAKIFLTDRVYLHAGIYEANPEDLAPDEVGYNFLSRKATGFTVPVELGYATTFAQEFLPRHYGIGGIYDASLLADPFRDANGAPAVLSGQPYAMDFGRSSVFARFDQMLWRPDPDKPGGLTAFGVALVTTSGRVQEDASFELGLLQLGTLPGRDRDTLGFVVNHQRFSQLFVDNILAARTSAGGSASVPRDEIMLELNYGLEVSKAFRLTPNLQYVINPDQMAEPFRTRAIQNALVLGARATIDLSALTTR